MFWLENEVAEKKMVPRWILSRKNMGLTSYSSPHTVKTNSVL